MNKLYAGGLSTALLFSGVGGAFAQAQRPADGPAYPLGTSQTLVRQLETQVAAGLANRTPATVTLRVSPTRAFAGRVSYREDLAKTGEYVVGDIAGVAGSSFQLRIQGSVVEGQIVLRASHEAYRYAADAQGNVTVRAVDINKVVCVDYNKPVGYREPAPKAPGTAQRVTVVSLQSFAGARGCVLLDVDGYALPAGTGWNNGNAYNAPSANMTDANVQAMWELVSEDFRPFSLNVTTDENVFNAYPKNMRMRCVISPGSGPTIANGAGGVAYVTSFKNNDDTPCWVFMSDPKSGGEAASHEVGHTLGLSHDGRISPAEGYYTGQDNAGAWAPIMGAGYYKPVTHWSRGEYNSANNQEDDLAIMAGATYNVGYRADDHSNAIAGATNLARSGSSLTGGGIIERTSDQDYFAFATAGGTVSFNVNTVNRYGDLDIVARLFNSGGGLIGTYDTQGGGNLNVSFSASLGAGTYYLQVDGTGSGNPATDGYSDYASLGTFSIAGSAPAPVGGVATMYRDCSYSGTAVALPVGDYNLAALQSRGILNDDLSSLTINGGYQVVLYADDNFSGDALTLTASNSCLLNNALGTSTWNDKTTSLRVQTATAGFSRQLEAELANVNNGMVVEGCTDAGGGQDMGYIDAGDYLVWNGITFPSTGTYLIEYRVASAVGGGTISADLNAGTIQLGNTAVPGTGGWQNWTTVSKSVNINAGTYNFGVYAQTSGYNINWVRITRTGARPATALASASANTSRSTLEIYPNPVVDQLTLASSTPLAGQLYEIRNGLGQRVAGGTLAPNATVDVASLPAGFYTITLPSADAPVIMRRFVK
ncbi:MAG: carbohydrate-binding protein [Bacteroidota bacterium]|nr:carbohydrate-binding protein [Bacteroidota bacterium]